MVFEIGTIDSIARALERDVLFLGLTDEESPERDIYVEAVTEWLDAHGFGYRLCTAFSEDIVYIEGGPACIYLDVPPISESVGLSAIVEKFGPIGGPPVDPGLVVGILTLGDALKNAEQDDPSFWDRFV